MSAPHDQQRDQRLAAAMACCIEAAENGTDIDHRQLLTEHPEFAAEIVEYLNCRQRIDQLAAPIRDIVAPAGATQKLLGDFRILREIGRGGMGVVYEAEQISLNRHVALKVLPFASVLDDRRLRRFKNEALAAAQLKHPNIVSVLCVGCDRSVHYYAMELIEGKSLAELRDESRKCPESRVESREKDAAPLVSHDAPAERGRCQESVAQSTIDTQAAALSTQRTANPHQFFQHVAQLGIQAADALQFAHESGIVHRDVKPANLLVDDHGHLWVADFGLAMTQTDADLTLSGDLLGTLRYMSPEQAAGNRAVLDERTDIYSLGITLYELLAGRPAFAETDRQRLIKRIIEDEPRPLASIDRRVPRDLETIVLKATAKDPADRYATMADLAQDMQFFSEDQPIAAKRQGVLQRTSRWVRRHHMAMATVTAFVLVLSVVQGLALWREAGLREQAELHRQRAESQQQRAWDITFDLMKPVNKSWARLPKAYVLQRQALDRAIAEHESILKDPQDRDMTSTLKFAELLLLRQGNSWHLGFDFEEDCEAAIAMLTALDRQDPGNATIRELLARAYGRRGNYLHVDLRFTKAARAFDESLDFVYVQDMAPAPGLTFALEESGSPLRAIERCAALESLGQDRLRLLEAMALPLLHLGRVEEARHAIDKAIELGTRGPPDGLVRKFWHARGLMAGANVSNQSGNPHEAYQRAKLAVEIYQELYGLAPELVWVTRKFAMSHRFYSDAAILLDKPAEAESALEEAIRLNASIGNKWDRSHVARTRFRLALLLSYAGRTDEASRITQQSFKAFEEFANLLPNEPGCVARLVMLLTLSPDVTLRDANRAVSLAEQLPSTSGQYWRLRALAHLRRGLHAEAIERAEQAMAQLEGGDSIDRFILAMAHWHNGDREQAQRWYDDAVAKMADGHPHLYHDLGPLVVRQLREEAERLLRGSASRSLMHARLLAVTPDVKSARFREICVIMVHFSRL